MFDATRLLGGLISSGLGRRGSSFLPSMGTVGAIAGVAAVGGISYAAYKHYKAGGFGQGGTGLFGGAPPQAAPGGFGGAPPGGASPFPGGGGPGGFGDAMGGGFAPPAFTTAQGAGFGQAGPPVAHAAPAAAVPATPADAQAQALLLVRAMIAAANIDGAIDPDERQRIVQGAEQAGFGPAERQALERELAAPHPPHALLGQARDPEIAAQLYLVTLLAIQLDSDAERTYARALPLILQIPAARVAEIHTQLGVQAP